MVVWALGFSMACTQQVSGSSSTALCSRGYLVWYAESFGCLRCSAICGHFWGRFAGRRIVGGRAGFRRKGAAARMVRGGGLMKQAIFNKSLLQYLACPLSKEPLRYCERSQELVSDAIGVAYPIIDGIPCLIPTRGRILDVPSSEEQTKS